MLVTLIMAVFNLVYWGFDLRRAKLLGIFQAVLLAQFVFGVAALELKRYGISAATPFRMFSLRTFLLFVLGVAHALGNRQAVLAKRSKWVLAGCVAVSGIWLLIPGNPVLRSARNIARVYDAWQAPQADLIRAVEWSAQKFPSQVGIVPTEIDPAQFYGANVIVSWKSVRYDRVSEWRKRLDDLLGGRLERYKPANLAAAFAALPLLSRSSSCSSATAPATW